MNRVSELYETATKFLALSHFARYIIGHHFRIVGFNEFCGDADKTALHIFTGATRLDFHKFKLLVEEKRKWQNGNEQSDKRTNTLH